MWTLSIDSWNDTVIEEVRRAQDQHHAGFVDASNLHLLVIENELRRLGGVSDCETRTELRHFTLWVMTIRAWQQYDIGNMIAADAAVEEALEEAWTFESECRNLGGDCFADQIVKLSFAREEILGWTGREAEAILLLDKLWREMSTKHPRLIAMWAEDFEERIDRWGAELGYEGTSERLGHRMIDTNDEGEEHWIQPLPFLGSIYDEFDDEFRVLNERSQSMNEDSIHRRMETIEQLLSLLDDWLVYSPNSVTVRTFRVESLLMKSSLELIGNEFSRFAQTWLAAEPGIEQLLKVAPEVTSLRRGIASRLQKIGRFARYREFPDDGDYLSIMNIGVAQLQLAFRIACIDVESRAFNQADAFLWIGLANSFLLEGKPYEFVSGQKRRWSKRWTAIRNLMVRRVLANDPNNDRARHLKSEYEDEGTTRSYIAWAMVNRVKWNICPIEMKVVTMS